jgi:hypothetical protein
LIKASISSGNLETTASCIPNRYPRIKIEPCCHALPGQFLEPAARSLLDGVPILLKMSAFRRSSGDVSQGVEDGIGVGAEFLPVAVQAGGEVLR